MKNWKINIAFALCGAFLFQIVFFNVLTHASPRANHPVVSIKSNVFPVQKRKTVLEMTGNLETIEYSLAETREEEEAHDYSPSTPIQVYSPLVHRVSSKRNTILPSDQYYSHFSSCRYLTLQVLRT